MTAKKSNITYNYIGKELELGFTAFTVNLLCLKFDGQDRNFSDTKAILQ